MDSLTLNEGLIRLLFFLAFIRSDLSKLYIYIYSTNVLVYQTSCTSVSSIQKEYFFIKKESLQVFGNLDSKKPFVIFFSQVFCIIILHNIDSLFNSTLLHF